MRTCSYLLVGSHLLKQQTTVKPYLKAATITPVPNNPTISSLHDYKPVALTLVVMKCFEKLVLPPYLMSYLPENFDQHQFAYKATRSTADAIAAVLQATWRNKDALCKLQYDPHQQSDSFLTDHPQTVRVGPHTSSTQTLTAGSPQGCVLSPFLFVLFTHDWAPTTTQISSSSSSMTLQW